MSTDLSEAIAAMILERQTAREAEQTQRVKRKAADRVEFKRTRDAGLIRRHAAKSARYQAAQLPLEC